MSFEEFMNKCYCDWYTMSKNIRDYEIDYLLEKADEFGYDRIDLARRISDAREKSGKQKIKCFIEYDGKLFETKNQIAEYLGVTHKTLKLRMDKFPHLFKESDELI